MKTLLYISSLAFLVAWVVCSFMYHMGMSGHIFLIVSIILAIQALILCPRTASAGQAA